MAFRLLQVRNHYHMNKSIAYIICIILIVGLKGVEAQDSLPAKVFDIKIAGKLSAWGHYNPNNTMNLQTGLRYIPQLNSSYKLSKGRKFDIEASANLLSTGDVRLADSLDYSFKAQPYRLWLRYSSKQAELRAGLQKINFGPAQLLRPLMWFDALDPRDPQQLTGGVWGLLGRYYLLNNTNIWLWGLYGNTEQRPWDLGLPQKNQPEAGARIQTPLLTGEAGLTYHYRQADLTKLNVPLSKKTHIPEHRAAFDARFDYKAGFWLEAVWIHKERYASILTNQHMLCLGTDYTFDVGNGLYMAGEHLLISMSEKAIRFPSAFNISATTLSYPIGIDDNLQGIAYFDWTNKAPYMFINWKHTFGNLASFVMLYSNPETYNLPQQGETGTQFAGKGIQIMLIYNH